MCRVALQNQQSGDEGIRRWGVNVGPSNGSSLHESYLNQQSGLFISENFPFIFNLITVQCCGPAGLFVCFLLDLAVLLFCCCAQHKRHQECNRVLSSNNKSFVHFRMRLRKLLWNFDFANEWFRKIWLHLDDLILKIKIPTNSPFNEQNNF